MVANAAKEKFPWVGVIVGIIFVLLCVFGAIMEFAFFFQPMEILPR